MPFSSIWRRGKGMFFIRAQTAARWRAPGIVSALALPHRIETEHQIAEARQCLAAELIGGIALSVGGVAHLIQHAGKRRAGPRWGYTGFRRCESSAGSRRPPFRRDSCGRSNEPTVRALSGVRSGMAPTRFQNAPRHPLLACSRIAAGVVRLAMARFRDW